MSRTKKSRLGMCCPGRDFPVRQIEQLAVSMGAHFRTLGTDVPGRAEPWLPCPDQAPPGDAPVQGEAIITLNTPAGGR